MITQHKDWTDEFPHTLTHRRAVLHFKTQLPVQTCQAFERLIAQPPAAKRVSEPLACPHSALFTKRQQLDSLKKKLRVQWGNPKRNGMYDWTIEELINTSEAHKRGARVPCLVGYGYSRSRFGLIDDVFLITQLLTGHVDGMTLLRTEPQKVATLIEAAFELLHSLHQQGIVHMDLWAANVMLPEQGDGLAQAIDLENSFSVPTAFLSETLGFQFGFFYNREVYRYITEANYDALVEQALANYPELERARFSRVYDISKHQDIGRLERRDVFLKGLLARRW